VVDVNTTDQDQFPAALRGAIHERGLSLESIQRRLSRQGLTVGRSTLSYWQNGRRRPTTASSLDVIRALEGILRVPPGSLTQALTVVPEKARGQALQIAAQATELNAMVRSVGCENALVSLETTGYVDLITVGPRGDVVRTQSVRTIRALAEIERYPIIFGGEAGGVASKLHHEALSGGRIGRVVRDEQRNLCVSELVLDRPLSRGEAHLVQFLVHDANGIPVTTVYNLISTPPLLYAIEVTFHSDRLPVQVEEFERSAQESADTFVRTRALSSDRRVTLVRERARRGIVGFRWTYP
jgi:transcriptional regulator with XRE-family HTH domain